LSGGKVVGHKNRDGTWSGTPDWTKKRTTLIDAKIADRDRSSIGVQGDRFGAIDCDISNPVLAAGFKQLLSEKFARAGARICVRSRPNSCRWLAMLQRDGGEDEFKKRRIEFFNEKRAKASERWNCSAPSKCTSLMAFIRAAFPMSGMYARVTFRTPAGKSRELHINRWTHSFSAAVDYAEMMGFVVGKRTKSGASGTRKPLPDASLQAPEPTGERVLELLKAVPCDDKTFETRDDFIPVLAAIKASLGPHADEHWGDVLDWAMNFPGAEEDYIEKIWNSIRDAEVGWSYLDGWGRKHGCTIGAQHAFGGQGDVMKIGLDGPVDWMVAENILVKDQEKFYNTNTGTWSTQNGINQAYADSVRPYRSAGSKDSAAVLLLNDPRLKRVVTTTSAPGEPPITTALKNGVSVPAVNLWRPSSVKAAESVTDDDVALFLDLFTMLFGPLGNPEAEHVLNYWAYILQNPGKKIGHALVITGPQGVGKDTILRPFFEGVGLHNVASISTRDLQGQFNFFLKSQVVYFQEAKARGQHDLYNSLKPWLSAQATFHVVNEKGLRQYTVPNVQNWVVSSNHDDAIALEADDRRFSVHRVLLEEPPSDGYFDPLHDWYDNGGVEKVVGWLLARDLSGFNPKAKPADTLAKKIMLREAQPASVRWVRELIGEGGKLGARSVLTVRELKDMAEGDWNAPREISEKQITAALKGEGFKAAHRVRLGNSMSQLWARGLDGSVTADAMRAHYLAEMEGAKCKDAA
jgi:hypothetical protein